MLKAIGRRLQEALLLIALVQAGHGFKILFDDLVGYFRKTAP